MDLNLTMIKTDSSIFNMLTTLSSLVKNGWSNIKRIKENLLLFELMFGLKVNFNQACKWGQHISKVT